MATAFKRHALVSARHVDSSRVDGLNDPCVAGSSSAHPTWRAWCSTDQPDPLDDSFADNRDDFSLGVDIYNSKCFNRAWSRLLPAPGSVGVTGSSPVSSTSPGEGSIPAYRDCGLHAAVSLNREDQSSSPIEVASAWPFRAIPTEDLGCGGLNRSRLMKAMRARLRRGSRRLWPGGAGLVR